MNKLILIRQHTNCWFESYNKEFSIRYESKIKQRMQLEGWENYNEDYYKKHSDAYFKKGDAYIKIYYKEYK